MMVEAIRTQPGAPHIGRDRLRLAVAAETVLMAMAVLPRLGTKSLTVDEGFSVAMARVPWGEFEHIVTTREANQGLYYLLLRGIVGVGDSEWLLRIVPALAAIATVPVIVFLGRRMFSDRVGLLAGLLLCVNGFFVQFGEFARAYSVTALLVTVSSLCFIRALDQPTTRRWMLWAVIAGMACYMHFFGALVIGAQLLSVEFLPRAKVPFRQLAQASGVLAIVLAPLAVFVALVPGDQIDFIEAPTVDLFFHVLDSLAGNGGAPLLACTGVLVTVAFVIGAQRWWTGNRPDAWPLVFTFSWLVVPVVAAFAVSIVKPLVQDDYLIVSLPAMVLLAAVGLDCVLRVTPRAVGAVAIVAVLVLGARSVADTYRDVDEENWRDATAFVVAHSRSDDALVFVTSDERTPFEYYLARLGYPDRAPAPVYPDDRYRHLVPVSVSTPKYRRTALDELLAGHSRIWILQRAEGGDRGAPRFELPADGYTRVDRGRFTAVDASLYRPRS